MSDLLKRDRVLEEYRVCMIINNNSPLHLDIGQQLREMCTYASDLNVQMATYCTSFAEKDFRAYAYRALEEKFDIVITPGMIFTNYMNKLLDEYGRHPFLFAACGNPERGGIVQSLEKPGNMLTGVIREPSDPLEVIRKFLPISQSRKNLLIPYTAWSEWGVAEEHVRAIKKFVLDNSDMAVRAEHVETGKEAVTLMQRLAGRYDAVLVLEHGVTYEVLSELSRIAWENQAVLCGSGVHAIRQGASCTFGGDNQPYALALFEYIRDFIMQNSNFGLMPVKVFPHNRRFYINADMLARVGLTQAEIKAFCDQEDVVVTKEWFYRGLRG